MRGRGSCTVPRKGNRVEEMPLRIGTHWLATVGVIIANRADEPVMHVWFPLLGVEYVPRLYRLLETARMVHAGKYGRVRMPVAPVAFDEPVRPCAPRIGEPHHGWLAALRALSDRGVFA